MGENGGEIGLGNIVGKRAIAEDDRCFPHGCQLLVPGDNAKSQRLHFASTGKTAAEIVFERADSAKPFMGLTTWKNSPKGKVLKSDVSVAKNYLNESEVSKLNRLVTMFIDFAELRALNRQVMTMTDWLAQVERFLNFTDQQVLRNAGRISHEMALAKAHEEYEKFRVNQDRDYLSDFDQALARYLKGAPRNETAF